MNRIATIVIAIVATATTQIDAFSTHRPAAYESNVVFGNDDDAVVSSEQFQSQPLAGLHLQLEELEDAETSTTEVLLNDDLTVSLGETDGPRYIASEGTWSESFNQEGEEFQRSFTMKLTRTFISGSDNEKNTNIGEFNYSVERTYVGNIQLVGGSLMAVNGEILDIDEIFGDRRVGFFNMIDTTEERKVINAPV